MNNLYQVLENTASKYPDNVALVFREHRIVYRDVKEATDRLAMGLKSLGLGPGDRIAIMLPNLPHFPMSIFALLKIGVTIVPVSIFFKAEEIHHQLEDSEVKGIIFWEGFRSTVLEAVQGLERCEKLIVLGEKSDSGEIRLTYLMETKDPIEETTEVGIEDTAFIVYTAGMTGRPRGAELTHHNVLSNIQACAEFLKFNADDGVVGVLSLYHPIGLTMVMGSFFYVGARVLLVPKFDAEAIFKLIGSEKPTFFIGVPSMYREFLKVEVAESVDISSLKRDRLSQ